MPLNNYTNTATDPTTYDPAQVEFNPDEDTVEGRMQSIIARNSAPMRQAETRSLQRMNQRGLLNSSMAVGAGQSALYDYALPIADRDAAASRQTKQYNADATNTALGLGASGQQAIEQIEAGGEEQRSTLELSQAGDLEAITAQGVQRRLDISAGTLSEGSLMDQKAIIDLALQDASGEIQADLLEQRGDIDVAIQDMRGKQAVEQLNISADHMEDRDQILHTFSLEFLAAQDLDVRDRDIKLAEITTQRDIDLAKITTDRDAALAADTTARDSVLHGYNLAFQEAGDLDVEARDLRLEQIQIARDNQLDRIQLNRDRLNHTDVMNRDTALNGFDEGMAALNSGLTLDRDKILQDYALDFQAAQALDVTERDTALATITATRDDKLAELEETRMAEETRLLEVRDTSMAEIQRVRDERMDGYQTGRDTLLAGFTTDRDLALNTYQDARDALLSQYNEDLQDVISENAIDRDDKMAALTLARDNNMATITTTRDTALALATTTRDTALAEDAADLQEQRDLAMQALSEIELEHKDLLYTSAYATNTMQTYMSQIMDAASNPELNPAARAQIFQEATTSLQMALAVQGGIMDLNLVDLLDWDFTGEGEWTDNDWDNTTTNTGTTTTTEGGTNIP